MRNQTLLRALLLGLLALNLTALLACGEEEAADDAGNNAATNNSTANNATTNNAANNATTNNSTANNSTANNSTSECTGTYAGPSPLGDTQFHMDTLALSKPAGPAGLLNNVLAEGLTAGTLCILVQMTGFSGDAPPATLQIRGDACVDNGDGTFSWSPEADSGQAPGNMDACGNVSSAAEGERPVLGFPVSLPDGGSLTLPIRDIQFSGLIGADGITGGVLTGAISGEDAANIVVPIGGGLPLANVLGGEGTQDADTDGDGAPDAWALEAEFTAGAVDFR